MKNPTKGQGGALPKRSIIEAAPNEDLATHHRLCASAFSEARARGESPRSVTVPSIHYLKGILQPFSQQIAEARGGEDPGDIVVMFWKIDRALYDAMIRLGTPMLGGPDGVTIFGMRPSSAVDLGGTMFDAATRKWLSTGPNECDVKILLFAEEGSSLVTLHFPGDGTVQVECEPEARAS